MSGSRSDHDHPPSKKIKVGQRSILSFMKSHEGSNDLASCSDHGNSNTESNSQPSCDNIGSEVEECYQETTGKLHADSGLALQSVTTATQLMPVDISKSAAEPPCQPKLNNFPSTKFEHEKLRSFNKIWYKYSWLEYSQEKDAVFCQSCRFFGSARNEPAFVTDGFRNWKKIGDRCQKHVNSLTHKSSTSKLTEWMLNYESGRGTILNQVDPVSSHSWFVEQNREVMKTVLELVLFCARQDIPLRGHREDLESLNKGNFLELMELVFNHSPELQAKFASLPKNAKMTSPDIQNDLLESAVNIILQQIRKEVADAKYFAVMADECKDHSKREIIGVSLRYFSKNQGKIKERAVGFIETADLCAASISEKILEVLSFFQLDDEKCVGFSFDGASVMSGIRNGVQAILKRKFVNAIYTHCHSHRLNLVMSAACRSDNEFKNLFDLLDQLVTFFTGTKRHAKFMELQAELHPNSQMLELTQSCDTRWTSRSALVERVLKLLDVIIEALSFFQSDRDGQTKTQALGLSLQVMNKQFIFLLVAFNRIFQCTDQATVSLQKVTVAVDVTIDLLAASKDTLIDFRNNDIQGIDKLNRLTEELCTKFSIAEMSSRPSRARKIPSHLSGSVLLESSGQKDAVDENKFRRLWFCALDAIIEEMNVRFGTLQTDLMIAADACRPESTNFMILDKISPVCELATVDVNMVTVELESVIFRKFIERRLGRGEEFPCLLSVLPVVDIDTFPNIYRLYSYLVTLPMTSCSVERMFSTMNRIKTKSRKSMLTDRLSNLSLLSFETELTRNLDYNDVIDYFKLKPRRLVL